jgi:hypothetical protein
MAMSRVDELERILERFGTVSGGDLARLLDVSRATLSRTINQAGSRVCRMGRTRGTIYGLPRRIRGLPRRIPIMRIAPDGAITRVGELNPLEDGGHWLEAATGGGVLYAGIPPFVADMQPQGYLGARFARSHRDLELPHRLRDWHDDHALLALARRGEDMSGDLVVGDESLQRLLAQRQHGPTPVPDEHYPDRARHTAEAPVASSVAGEAPKFIAFSASQQCHVIVKFTSGAADEADQRWRDLFAAESIALETLADYGFDVPATRILDRAGQPFLEVERFDRCGSHGRAGVLSMASIDAEFVGFGMGWSQVAETLARQRWITGPDCARIRWLDAFGELIGNTDRHLGNVSFHPDSSAMPSTLTLAPVYDMLPMALAPGHDRTVPASFEPRPPSAHGLDQWLSAATAAVDYWARLTKSKAISESFRSIARASADTVADQRARVDPEPDSAPRPG